MSRSCAPSAGDLPLDALVGAFETVTLSPVRFHHREHMRVALWYLARESEEAATARVRRGLQQFLAHHGLDGYHETVTVFWMKVLAARLARTDPGRPLNDRMEEVIAWCTAARPLAAHYTAETLASERAKTTWVEPDRLPLVR